MTNLTALFGNDPKAIVCDACEACCGRTFADMPDTLYCQVIDNEGSHPTINFTLSKVPTSDERRCNVCNAPSANGALWTSNIYAYVDDGIINPNASDEVCCIQVGLRVQCDPEDITELSECIWDLFVNWSGGESVTVIAPDIGPGGANDHLLSSCNPIEGTIPFEGSGEVAACILRGSELRGVTIQISESPISGGSVAQPCRWSCCQEYPPLLYATITSSCHTLNGLVVTLYPNGSGWRGTYDLRDCCPGPCGVLLAVSYGPDVWSTAPTQCTVEAGLAIDGISCTPGTVIGGFIIETAAIECPPFTFSGEIIDTPLCLLCCPVGTTISIEITG